MSWWAAIPGIIQGAGELFGGSSASRQSSLDRQTQHAMMKEGIQWRVADAKKAGVHPLYALGAQGFSYSPSASYAGDYGAGSFAQAGQDIQRARQAALTNRERRAEMARLSIDRAVQNEREGVLFEQQVERNNLENQLLASRIGRLNSPGTPPGFPDGRAPPGAVETHPAQRSAAGIGSESREAGAIRDFGYSITPRGLAIVPSESMADRADDFFFQDWGWGIRNNLMPWVTGTPPPHPDLREFPLPQGQRWTYDYFVGEYRPQDIRTGEYLPYRN